MVMNNVRGTLALALALAGLLGVNEGAIGMERTISVSGEGSATAPPDMAVFQAAVVSEGETAAAAMEANNEAMKKVLQVLREQQIADKDIQTSRFDLSPRYRHDRENTEPKIIGYTATNQVRVKVRNLPKLGQILDALVRSGSNQIHNIGFDIENKEGLMNQARTAAVRNAQARAELYAQAAGVKLGKVVQISESPVHIPEPRMAMRAMAAESSVPMATGEQEISASVSVVYAIEE
jgi:uncharacterized protein YggE